MSALVPFSLRVRLGQCEVEISGNRDDVLKTLDDLPNLVAMICEAFAEAGSRVDVSSKISASSESVSSMPMSAAYPSIQSTGNCSDAILRLLSTDWVA